MIWPYPRQAGLMNRYNLMKEGYQEKLRKKRPEPEESVEQFIYRIRVYLEKWVELSNVQATLMK